MCATYLIKLDLSSLVALGSRPNSSNVIPRILVKGNNGFEIFLIGGIFNLNEVLSSNNLRSSFGNSSPEINSFSFSVPDISS